MQLVAQLVAQEIMQKLAKYLVYMNKNLNFARVVEKRLYRINC